MEENGYWVRDYAIFMAVKAFFGGKSWDQWPEDIRKRWGYAMDYYQRELYYEIEFYEYIQFVFLKQWNRLKEYALLSSIMSARIVPRSTLTGSVSTENVVVVPSSRVITTSVA